MCPYNPFLKRPCRPNGFYENKLELLTETIIFHERQQQLKQRQLGNLTRVRINQIPTLIESIYPKIPKFIKSGHSQNL